MEENLVESLKKVLSKDERLISSEGDLLKNKVVELGWKLDEKLIETLYKNKELKQHFFKQIDGALIFDQNKFMKFVDNKEFLPDSFTSFKNKIGLTQEDSFISKGGEVVLSWAYKDCILEGGMTKEDKEKRNEVFFNEILAPDQIDRLKDTKVLTNFKKYSKKGVSDIKNIKSTDNLIIKGNNLLALHTIKKKFVGRVKLIYIDPPYNTGSDSFNYNDSFNHSTWLTFMKNRLEVAKELLSEDGVIFIQIDHHELGYINILMDEIFGIANKIQVISIKVSAPSGFKAVNPGPIDVTEFILFYGKNKSKIKFKPNYVTSGYNTNYNLYLEKNDTEDVKKWEFIPIKKKVLGENGFKDEKEAKEKFGKAYWDVIKNLTSYFAFNNAENIVSIRDLHKPTDKVKKIQEESRINREKILIYKKVDGENMYLYKGGVIAFYSNKLKEINGKKEITELLTNFWNHISWAGIAKEGGIRLKNGKKPEKLIKQIIDISTKKGDIVLDYHLGSGTTCAVAHKMGRQYIGIEQLDYEENGSVTRLKNVIKGDQSGISKDVGWKSGGEFVYCELMRWNQIFIDKITQAKNSKELIKIWKEMKEKAFLSYRVKVSEFDSNKKEFEELSLENQKKFLVKTLDMNQLYVNLSEVEDKSYGVSKKDKELNKKFHGGL